MGSTKVNIIGLSGKSGSGKSTVAKQVAARHNNVRVVSFADALRYEVADEFQDLDVYTKPTPPHVRALLIAWGCARRAIDPMYWVKWLEHTLELDTTHTEPGVYIIDDVRFLNEAQWIHAHGGKVLRVECSPAPLRVSSGPDETELDDYPKFDYTYTAKYGDLDWVVENIGQRFVRTLAT